MQLTRYFWLRSRMGPPASNVPLWVVAALAMAVVIGLFADASSI
ncbi:MAG: hypothetical protein AAF628_10710 [Planctomycetota bacterium]